MIVGVHSWSFRDRFRGDPDFTIDKAIDLAADMGFESMEILTGKAGETGVMATETDMGTLESEDPDYLRAIIDHAAGKGIRIHCFSTYNDFAYVKDEPWRQENITYIQRWLRLAGELGVPNIRMLTGYYLEGEDRTRLEQLTREGIAACVPVAEEAGVNMAIENHNTIFMKADEIVELIQANQSARLTTCPDPSNWQRTFFTDECTPEVREDVYQSLEKAAPHATNTHLKVKAVEDGGLRGWDLPRLLGIYQKAGYTGPIHLESVIEGEKVDPLYEARKILSDALAQVA